MNGCVVLIDVGEGEIRCRKIVVCECLWSWCCEEGGGAEYFLE